MNTGWLNDPIKIIEHSAIELASERQAQLTKPPGSLGSLEQLAVRLSAMQQTQRPRLDTIRIVVFAADHGIADEQVSAFPQAVTTEMVRNFARGGAAISVLARELTAALEVVDLGTVVDPGQLEGVISQRISVGTRNFSQEPAMTEQQCQQALEQGRQSVLRAQAQGAALFIGGEMGIANTTSAAAVAAALLDQPAHALVGPGTGLDDAGIKHKAEVVAKALALHKEQLQTALDVLRCLGGFEIAALTGAYMTAAQHGVPVVIDGYIASVAALVAARIQADVTNWFFYSHHSAEPGHALVLAALQASPLLNLSMRLGEGSGAAVAVSLLRHACALHGEMATFSEAGVSNNV